MSMRKTMREPRLVTLLQERAAATPDQVAYWFTHDDGVVDTLTYRQLADRARRLSRSLLRQQASSGPGPALLLYPPGLDYVVAIFACFAAGVSAVPAYPPDPWRPEVALARLARVVADARPASVLADESLAPVLSLVGAAELTRALVGPADEDFDEDTDEAGRWARPGGDGIAIVQYTSGSTRSPRGVVIRHRNLEHNIAAIARCFRLTERSRAFSWLPPYHDMGLIGGILTPMYVGIPVGLMSPLDFLKNPISWLHEISATGITASGGPNFAYDLCVRRPIGEDQLAALDLRSWSVAFNGAEQVRWRTLEAFARKFAPAGFRRSAFYPCYGLAEATLIVAGGHWDGTVFRGTQRIPVQELPRQEPAPSGDAPPARVSCGHSLLGQELVVVNPDTGRRAAAGVDGEVWLRGPSVTTGYWSSESSQEDSFGLLDGARYVRTGDLGYLAGDELVITGRLKDLIVHRGVNYHPGDLEDAAVAGDAEVRPVAAAFPVEVEDGQESAVVLVVEARSTSVDRGELAARVRERALAVTGLAPDVVVVAPPGTIPRTSSGKVQRSACRARFLAGDLTAHIGFTIGFADGAMAATLEGHPTPTTDGVPAQLVGLVRGVFAAVCGVSACGPGDTLFELGGDSLRAAEVASVLESALDLPVPVEVVLESLTPATLAAYVVRLWDAQRRDRRRLTRCLEELASEPGP